MADVKLTGQGCSISQSSASMMSTAVKGKSLAEARATIRTFKSMMSIHEQRLDGADGDRRRRRRRPSGEPEVSLGDLEALQGVVKFPVRIKCATLSWNTLAQALDHLESRRPPAASGLAAWRRGLAPVARPGAGPAGPRPPRPPRRRCAARRSTPPRCRRPGGHTRPAPRCGYGPPRRRSGCRGPGARATAAGS